MWLVIKWLDIEKPGKSILKDNGRQKEKYTLL